MIFDIQNYCLYDGPGIRTCVYFKGCPLHCQWCHNPESIRPQPEMAYWADRCVGCKKCVDACPNRALSLDSRGIHRDPNLCDACGTCAKVCPNEAVELIGHEVSVPEIMEQIERDKPFFNGSGGGVTVTGGEPTFQVEFLFELSEALKKQGIHVAMETCGLFPKGLIPRLLKNVDLFLFDLKQIDSAAHKKGTGAPNQKILGNFVEILENAGPDRIIPRIPCIPGFNTAPGEIDALVHYLREAGYAGEVHLMPYHDWARGKHERLGRKNRKLAGRKFSEADKKRITTHFNENNYAVTWGG